MDELDKIFNPPAHVVEVANIMQEAAHNAPTIDALCETFVRLDRAHDRRKIEALKSLQDFTGVNGKPYTDADARERVRMIEEERKRKEEAAKMAEYIKDAAAKVDNGADGADVARMIAKEAAQLQPMETERFKALDELEQGRALFDKFKNTPPALPLCGWTLQDENGQAVPMVAPYGGITIIGAPTNHGKSTILRNIALSLAQDGRDGCVLFFTYEQTDSAQYAAILKTFLKVDKQGFETFINHAEEDENAQKLEEFNALFTADKLRIIQGRADVGELLDALRYYARTRTIKAVLIDYVQKMRNAAKPSSVRTDEINTICEQLNEYVNETNTALIMAAQLSRKGAEAPDDMDNSSLSASVSLEQTAAEVYLLWNSSFDAKGKGNGQAVNNLKNANNFCLGNYGSIYIKHTKSRSGKIGDCGALSFNGATGRVENFPNYDAQDTSDNDTETY